MAATIRTDRYELMQNHPALDGVGTGVVRRAQTDAVVTVQGSDHWPGGARDEADQHVRFAPDLIERLLADAGEGADTLPLLSLTLARLYTD